MVQDIATLSTAKTDVPLQISVMLLTQNYFPNPAACEMQ